MKTVKLNDMVAAYVDGGDRIVGKVSEIISPTIVEVQTEDGQTFDVNLKALRKLKMKEKLFYFVNVYNFGLGTKVFKSLEEADAAAAKSATPRIKTLKLKEVA